MSIFLISTDMKTDICEQQETLNDIRKHPLASGGPLYGVSLLCIVQQNVDEKQTFCI